MFGQAEGKRPFGRRVWRHFTRYKVERRWGKPEHFQFLPMFFAGTFPSLPPSLPCLPPVWFVSHKVSAVPADLGLTFLVPQPPSTGSVALPGPELLFLFPPDTTPEISGFALIYSPWVSLSQAWPAFTTAWEPGMKRASRGSNRKPAWGCSLFQLFQHSRWAAGYALQQGAAERNPSKDARSDSPLAACQTDGGRYRGHRNRDPTRVYFAGQSSVLCIPPRFTRQRFGKLPNKGPGV